MGVHKLFKRLLVPFCLILLVSSAYATIYIVEPVDKAVKPTDSETLEFGKIARGETLRVVVKKKSDFETRWSSLSVDKSLLPAGWQIQPLEEDKTLIVNVAVPKNAEISTQRIKFVASSPSGQVFNESFYATVSVKDSLLSASIESLGQESILGEDTTFGLVLINDSIAEHSVRVESSLPDYWFSPMEVRLKPHETKQVQLVVSAHSYGEKNFSFTVSSLLNEKKFSFPAKMNVRPNLVGMFQAPFAGFSFFSPSMLTYYLLNGFLSIFR